MRKIKLSNSDQFALVDDEDFESANQFTWLIKSSNSSKIVFGWVLNRHINLSNFVKQTEELLDHRDTNFLNNQKSNLRLASHSQNMMNRKKFKNCSSQYKGVCWDSSVNKWYAQIGYNKKRKNLGWYTSELAAARAYNRAALKFHGEFARINDLPL